MFCWETLGRWRVPSTHTLLQMKYTPSWQWHPRWQQSTQKDTMPCPTKTNREWLEIPKGLGAARRVLVGLDLFQHVPRTLDQIQIWEIWRQGWCSLSRSLGHSWAVFLGWQSMFWIVLLGDSASRECLDEWCRTSGFQKNARTQSFPAAQ